MFSIVNEKFRKHKSSITIPKPATKQSAGFDLQVIERINKQEY